MDTRERIAREREADRRARARRARAGFLRGRVIAVSLLCFGVLWAIVFVQMATGNDPVLSTKPQAGTQGASHRSGPSADQGSTATVEPEPSEPELVEELELEPTEPEVVEEPELEPLTTSQS